MHQSQGFNLNALSSKATLNESLCTKHQISPPKLLIRLLTERTKGGSEKEILAQSSHRLWALGNATSSLWQLEMHFLDKILYISCAIDVTLEAWAVHVSNVTGAQMFTVCLLIKLSRVEDKFPPWWSIKIQPNLFYYPVFSKLLDLSKTFQRELRPLIKNSGLLSIYIG